MKTMKLLTVVLLFGVACGQSRSGSSGETSGSDNQESSTADAAAATKVAADAAPAPPDAAPPEPTCEERLQAAAGATEAALAPRRACRWNHECVALPLSTPCVRHCPTTVAASQVVPARADLERIGASADCTAAVAGGCLTPQPSCPEQTYHCEDGSCATRPANAPEGERRATAIPEQNARARDDDPPERPAVGAAEERARRLFAAIVHDDPARAADFYLPREAFLELKGIADPGGYWDRLFPRYLEDIHSLHEVLPDIERAEFLRFELVRRGGWVRLREEGNSLPYWVSRHSWIHYRVGDEERRLEVRVLITWGEEWYVTHLCEFHCDRRECCRPPD